MSFRLCDNLI